MKKRSDYFERQINILSNLGLFYIIIIALFAIPMIGAFVAVFIKSVIDFKYAVIFGGVLILLGIVYFLIRVIMRLYRSFRKDGGIANQDLKELLQRGQPVQVSFLDGLVTVSGGRNYQPMKIIPSGISSAPVISDDAGQISWTPADTVCSIIGKLKELSDLKEKSVISEEEFQMLKKKLMNEC